MVRIKRIYDKPAAQDGVRVLVDRLWPRGVSKDKAHLDRWEKELAPTDELRHWFGHDPEKWHDFRARYRQELEGQGALLEELAGLCTHSTVTLLYAAKDEEHNNAVVLKELLEDSSIG